MRRLTLGAFFTMTTMMTTAKAAAETVQFEFFEPKTRAPLVHGEEQISRDGADVVKKTAYKTLKGAVAQTEEVRYGADSLQLATYHFEDKLTGEMADVQVKDGKAVVQYREDRESDLKTSTIDWGPSAISGKALPDVIVRGWDKLMSGDKVAFDLYVPFRLETIGFQAEKTEGGGGKPTTVRVEPSNWLIRRFAPSIDFVFEGTPPRLVRYVGPSMVDIGGEKNKKVEIDFKTP